jgi:hypothetical protein
MTQNSHRLGAFRYTSNAEPNAHSLAQPELHLGPHESELFAWFLYLLRMNYTRMIRRQVESTV